MHVNLCVSAGNAQNRLLVCSAYQIVVEEVNPQRTRRQASSDCYEVITDPLHTPYGLPYFNLSVVHDV